MSTSSKDEPETPATAGRPAPAVEPESSPTIRVGGLKINLADWPAPLSPDRFPLNLVRPSSGSLEMEPKPQGEGVSKPNRQRERESTGFGNGSPSRGNLPTPNSKLASVPRVLTSEDVLSLAQQKIGDAGAARRWGLHVQAGAVTLFVGQTSAGKTTFLHNLAFHLAEGQEFLDIKPPRALKVLYGDYESTYAVLEDHGRRIGVSTNLAFLHPEELPKGPDLIAGLTDLIERDHYDVVIVDPLIKAFPVKDENDNAEASAQVDHFKDLARRTGVAIVLVHNAGHGREQGALEDDPFYGRGATARTDSVDIGIAFRKNGDRRRYLKVGKSRYSNFGERIDLEFAGELSYRLASRENSTSEPPTRDLLAEAVRVVREESEAGRSATARHTIRDRLSIKANSAEDRALTEVLKRAVPGHLTRRKHGYYSLPVADQEPDERAPREMGQ